MARSRPAPSARKASERSAYHFTGRPSFFAANSTATCSGYAEIFNPNEPPTSGVSTRSARGSATSPVDAMSA